MKCWRDIKEPIDYIYDKYCRAQKRRTYLYSCSLGATITSHYMIEDANNCPPFEGAAFYGTPINPLISIDYFKTHTWGFYNYAMGVEVAAKIKELLP